MKEKTRRFRFKLELYGDGPTPEAAWEDAVECFQRRPGACPDDYEEE